MLFYSISHIDTVDSTNDAIKRLYSVGEARHFSVLCAKEQLKGRGQKGNIWESEPGKNLLFSILLVPNAFLCEKQFYISKAISLAILKTIENTYTQANYHIKWPNDILANKKKICGILIESGIMRQYIDKSIIGVGLNVNQEVFPDFLPHAISLYQLGGKNFNQENILKELLDWFYSFYSYILRSDFKSLDTMYLERLFQFDAWAEYESDDGKFSGRIVGLGDYGTLKVEDKNGNYKQYGFKEIRFLNEI